MHHSDKIKFDARLALTPALSPRRGRIVRAFNVLRMLLLAVFRPGIVQLQTAKGISCLLKWGKQNVEAKFERKTRRGAERAKNADWRCGAEFYDCNTLIIRCL